MSKPVHAFFDFDGTLIEGDSILHWLEFYYRRKPVRRFFQLANAAGLALYGLRLISSHTLKRAFLWPMSFEKPEVLDALAKEFVLKDLAFRFHAPVLEKLWAHHRLGHRTVLISASATFYLKHLREFLPSDCLVLGTEMEWGGILRLGFPRYRDGNLRGENKVRLLRRLGMGETGSSAFAYSDHSHDVPLLEFAAFPECVRPTAKLRRLAHARGWPVWDWPRERPAWKLALEELLLLVFAWCPRFLHAR